MRLKKRKTGGALQVRVERSNCSLLILTKNTVAARNRINLKLELVIQQEKASVISCLYCGFNCC